MTRNELFSQVHATMSADRTKFDLSKRRFTTFNQGQLVPIYVNSDILPGDTFDVMTKFKIRSRTPLSPVLDNAKVDTYWFFCPYTQLWDHAKEFYGDSKPSAYYAPVKYNIPALGVSTIMTNLTTKAAAASLDRTLLHTLWDHFGLPLNDATSGTNGANDSIPISVLPFRMYKQIWNEWFRDESTQDPQFVNTGDTPSYTEYYCTDSNGDMVPLLRASKIHDFYTSCLPAPQKGDPIFVPLVGMAPVRTGPNNLADNGYDSSKPPIRVVSDDASVNTGGDTWVLMATGQNGLNFDSATNSVTPSSSLEIQPGNLWADLNSVDMISINALRVAISSQHILESLSRGGSRFEEFLRTFFSVVSPELVTRIPQYLGGQTALIQNNQVIQTGAPAAGDPLGQTGAFSLTMDAAHSFTKSFDMPGILMCLAVVRVEHTYEQRIDRMWTRSSFFDFWLKPLNNLGERQVKNYELWFNPPGTDNDQGFGYQENWNEYRYGINDVSGEMRPSAANPGMRPWQYTDHYTSRPVLSAAWIEEGEENINQTLAVDSSLADQFFGDFFFNIFATRPLSARSDPGLNRL